MSAAEDDLKIALEDLKNATHPEDSHAFLRVTNCITKLTAKELIKWEAIFRQMQGNKSTFSVFITGLLTEIVKTRVSSKPAKSTAANLVSSNHVMIAGKKIEFSICRNTKMHVGDKLKAVFSGSYTVKYNIYKTDETLNITLQSFRLTPVSDEGYAFFGFTFKPTKFHVAKYHEYDMKCEKDLIEISENSIETDAATWGEILTEVSEYVKTTKMPCLLLQKEFVEKTLQGKLALKVHGDVSLLRNTGSRSNTGSKHATKAQPVSANNVKKNRRSIIDKQDESMGLLTDIFKQSAKAADLI